MRTTEFRTETRRTISRLHAREPEPITFRTNGRAFHVADIRRAQGGDNCRSMLPVELNNLVEHPDRCLRLARDGGHTVVVMRKGVPFLILTQGPEAVAFGASRLGMSPLAYRRRLARTTEATRLVHLVRRAEQDRAAKREAASTCLHVQVESTLDECRNELTRLRRANELLRREGEQYRSREQNYRKRLEEVGV